MRNGFADQNGIKRTDISSLAVDSNNAAGTVDDFVRSRFHVYAAAFTSKGRFQAQKKRTGIVASVGAETQHFSQFVMIARMAVVINALTHNIDL